MPDDESSQSAPEGAKEFVAPEISGNMESKVEVGKLLAKELESLYREGDRVMVAQDNLLEWGDYTINTDERDDIYDWIASMKEKLARIEELVPKLRVKELEQKEPAVEE